MINFWTIFSGFRGAHTRISAENGDFWSIFGPENPGNPGPPPGIFRKNRDFALKSFLKLKFYKNRFSKGFQGGKKKSIDFDHFGGFGASKSEISGFLVDF